MPRLFQTSPLNAIWEGSGNVIALDIQRALRDPDTHNALQEEIARIGFDITALNPLTGWLTDTPNPDARLFAERAALIFAADALPAGPIREAWIALRIKNPSHIWGANAGMVDARELVDRLEGWHQT